MGNYCHQYQDRTFVNENNEVKIIEPYKHRRRFDRYEIVCDRH